MEMAFFDRYVPYNMCYYIILSTVNVSCGEKTKTRNITLTKQHFIFPPVTNSPDDGRYGKTLVDDYAISSSSIVFLYIVLS